jgi:hypothetical protein
MEKPIGIIRASSFGSLLDCSLRWYYQNVQGIRSPTSGVAYLGTSIHAGTAAFDSATLEGAPIDVEQAVDVTVETIKNPSEDVAWDEDASQGNAIDIGAALTQKYCDEIAPGRVYQAVELTCDALDIETDYGTVRLTGQTDRVRVNYDGSKGISDLKTGKTAVGTDGAAKTDGHHIQLGVYRILAEHASGETFTAPSEIIGLQTNSKLRVGTGTVKDDRTALVGNDEHPGLIELAAKMLKSGIFPPNPKSMLCSAKYCPAHGICIYHN